MRFSIANHRTTRRAFLAEPCGWLEARIGLSLEEIASVAPGRLFSLSFDLPLPLFDVAADARGDRSWLAPDDGVYFFGGGSVSGFGDLDADQWRAACRLWVRLGEAKASPIGFLTAPPAPEGGRTKICLPEILLRRNAGRQSVSLIGFRDSTPVAAVARGWMKQFRAMVAPQEGAAAGGVEQRSCRPDLREWGNRVRAATAGHRGGPFRQSGAGAKACRDDAQAHRRRFSGAGNGAGQPGLPHHQAAGRNRLRDRRKSRIAGGQARREHRQPCARRHVGAVPLAPKKMRAPRPACWLRPRSASNMRWWSIPSPATCAKSATRSSHAPAPELMRLRGLQHLWTPVAGTLRPGFDLLDAIDRLHPTPAVLGFPKIAARDWLERRRGAPRRPLYRPCRLDRSRRRRRGRRRVALRPMSRAARRISGPAPGSWRNPTRRRMGRNRIENVGLARPA